MKRLIFALVITLNFIASAKAQQIDRFVFSSGNGSATNAYGESVQFTIGQAFFTETLSNNKSEVVTQGFEQPISFDNLLLASASFKDLSLLKLDVYPNPAVDYTELELNLIDHDGAKVMLIDTWGQVVKTENFQVPAGNQKLHFNLGTLADGVYTISVKANKRSYAKKLIVSNTRSRTVGNF